MPLHDIDIIKIIAASAIVIDTLFFIVLQLFTTVGKVNDFICMNDVFCKKNFDAILFFVICKFRALPCFFHLWALLLP